MRHATAARADEVYVDGILMPCDSTDRLKAAMRSRVIDALQTIVQFETDVELRAAARARYLELTAPEKSSAWEDFSRVA